jgi:hypothetical protein
VRHVRITAFGDAPARGIPRVIDAPSAGVISPGVRGRRHRERAELGLGDRIRESLLARRGAP